MKNIAILCSGGDVSGMNPAIKRFVEYAKEKKLTPYFVYNGYEGLINNNIKKATYTDVSEIINRGGTTIGSARSSRFRQFKYREIAKQNLDKLDIDSIIVLGGNGSFAGLHQFYKDFNIKFCGIPSTIDNDINGTDYCLGVDTALNIIKDAIDSIRDTASSSKRAFVIETMGRDCGYLALISALTSGADMCLIPEVEYSLDEYEKRFKTKIQNEKKYILAIVAEGIKQDSREISDWFKNTIGIDSQVTILGYIQRGGNPSVYDRLMAYKFINYAIDSLLSGNNENIICYNKNGFNYQSIEDVTKPYNLDTNLIKNF